MFDQTLNIKVNIHFDIVTNSMYLIHTSTSKTILKNMPCAKYTSLTKGVHCFHVTNVVMTNDNLIKDINSKVVTIHIWT